jgi:Leucine-rich repeat (LRR) protein
MESNSMNIPLAILKCLISYPSVTLLDSKKINLIKIHNSVFLNLEMLTILDLRDNKIMKISKNIAFLKCLKTLKLDQNQISHIPTVIGELINLEHFSISHNNIAYISSSIQYLSRLKSLKISYNKITTLPIELGQLKSLETLYIEANHFVEIPTTLCYLKHLCELSFEWLEFLDPPFLKLVRDNIGKTIVTLLRTTLQDMIKDGILYCCFFDFIQKNSNKGTKKLSSSKSDKALIKKDIAVGDSCQVACKSGKGKDFQKQGMKIFLAIENSYVGVVKVNL